MGLCSGIFDSHAHYFDRRFENETDGADAVLARDVFDAGIDGVINVATNVQTTKLCIEQAAKYEKMYASAGIHPEDVQYCENDIDTELQRLVSLIGSREEALKNKIVAIGEIGLDYHYEETNKEMQIALFRRQMAMAQQLGLPVVIHDRDAHEDVMAVIRDFPAVRGVMHSFSGSAEMAKELVKLGYMISFSGTVTFKNARKPKEAAAVVPNDRILIETDAPYLAPHPLRGSLNHSGNLEYTNRAVAEIKGMSEEECAALTETNARRFFGI